jgi:hypothetical protein
MQQYHCPGLKWIGGKSLRCIAHLKGEWAALLSWGSASKNCSHLTLFFIYDIYIFYESDNNRTDEEKESNGTLKYTNR